MTLISKHIVTLLAIIAMMLNFGCATISKSTEESVTVSGTAAYRQRIAMPPEAVLTVSLEDVSRADTGATVLAENKQAFGERQVPLEFALEVPSSKIKPESNYNLRAKIEVNGQLRFITTRSYPVLTRGGAKNKAELWLDAVQSNASGQTSAGGFAAPMSETADFGTLPATFSGVTPCADCPGIEETLTLRSDGLFLLRRVYQDKSVNPFIEHGRWTAEGNKLALTNASGVQYYERSGDTLRKLDTSGNPIKTTANIVLNRAAQVDPVGETHEWRGEFRYMADAAAFTDCASGIRWPVAMNGDYLATERAYLKTRNVPGSPLIVDFQGKLEQRPGMEDKFIEMLVIEKIGGSHPGESCSPSGNKLTAKLLDTYWRLVDLNGEKIPFTPSHKRQIRLTLASAGSRVIGFSGCNQFTGTFKQTGNELKFSQMAGTMMACVSPYMEFEGKVLKMLNATTGYRIKGEQLYLLEGDKVVTSFESLYLR